MTRVDESSNSRWRLTANPHRLSCTPINFELVQILMMIIRVFARLTSNIQLTLTQLMFSFDGDMRDQVRAFFCNIKLEQNLKFLKNFISFSSVKGNFRTSESNTWKTKLPVLLRKLGADFRCHKRTRLAKSFG